MISIIQSDAVKWAREYTGPLFHALLCDPPYHLTTIVKRFGKANMSDDTQTSDRARRGVDSFARLARSGFMGQTWDGGDVAFQPETWSAFMKVLYPGAFGMAFASSRGWHRLAVAIEDAGFIIHPTIFGWLYGSGFPKATRIDTQIDKMTGSERKVVGEVEFHGHNAGSGAGSFSKNAYEGQTGIKRIEPITAPASDLSKAWEGHRYGLQALKPALEPIIVFQKPYEGKPIDCMVKTGAGALNIDGGRVSVDPEIDDPRLGGNGDWSSDKMAKNVYNGGYSGERVGSSPLGRWPANFIIEDKEAAEALDRQSGIQKGGFVRNRTAGARVFNNNGNDTGYETIAEFDESDAGASRFFFNVQEQIDESDPVYYCSKASKSERDEGIGEFEKNVTAPDFRPNDDVSHGVQSRLHGATVKGHNPHPTVKPISLAKYLATLLLPPEMYAPRRLFVPFSGVSSECIGAHQALWEEIVGIEMEEKYCEIGRARAEYWMKKGVQLEMPL